MEFLPHIMKCEYIPINVIYSVLILHSKTVYSHIRNGTCVGPRKQFRSCRNDVSCDIIQQIPYYFVNIPFYIPPQPCDEPLDLRKEVCAAHDDGNYTYTPLNGNVHTTAVPKAVWQLHDCLMVIKYPD